MKKIYMLLLAIFVSMFIFMCTAEAKTGEIDFNGHSYVSYSYQFKEDIYSLTCTKKLLSNTNHSIYNFNMPYNTAKPLYDIYAKDIIADIDSSSFEKIRKLAYYGDMKFNETKNNIYYGVTNALIIKALKPNSFSYIPNDKHSLDDLLKAETILEKETLEYFIKPNLDNRVINIDLNEEVTIEDQNNILSSYQLVSAIGDSVEYEINDNKINLKAIKPGETIFKFKKEYNEKDYNMELLYEEGNTSFALTAGNFILYSTFSVKVNGGRIGLDIKDDKNGLSNEKLNVIYGIYNKKNDLVYQINTNVEGLFYSDYLPFGKYYIKEISNNNIYQENKTLYNVNLDSEQSIIEIKNYKKIPDNQIVNNNMRNVTISFFDEEGRVIEDDVIISIMDKSYQINGKTSIILKEGNYLIKILKVPDDFALENITKLIDVNDNMEIEIVLKYKEQGYGTEVVDLEVPNTWSFKQINYLFIFVGLRYVKKFSKW